MNTTALSAAFLALALVAAGSAHALKRGPPRTRPIDMLVIHSTGGPSCDIRSGQPIWIGAGTLDDNLREIEAHPRLGIHCMIDRDGAVRASVPEDEVAHHVLRPSGRSIAIELVKDGDGRDPFPGRPDRRAGRAAARHRARGHRAPLRCGSLDPCAPQRRRKVDPGDALAFAQVLERVFRSD
jgi:hypothetical protein